jgi:hypothetical protein
MEKQNYYGLGKRGKNKGEDGRHHRTIIKA